LGEKELEEEAAVADTCEEIVGGSTTSNSFPKEVVAVRHTFEEIVGDSAPLRRVLGQIEIVAPTDATVLILGETGTGKELVARATHNLSERRKHPFVTLNCAAIPAGLLESELFGYERGAFTGAVSSKIGRFEMAHQGTLFLDEVGDIPLDLQPKLLRALQEKKFERLGGTRTIPINVRLVAATNRNLTQMMEDNLFRSDLYYRLKVFPITVPALRDRPEDIPLLVRHFTQKYSTQMKRKVETIPSETMQALVRWPWPGNVRELENFIERAVILSTGRILRAPLHELRAAAVKSASSSTLEQVEREHIIRVLRETCGVITTAATRLGVPRTTLNARMQKLGISRRDL
jgi:formate hydrogenlyase transcriptional activator